MTEAIVVGGGPVGLLASILLARKGYVTTLLERDDELGGLMRSIHAVEGFEFDNGTRFAPKLTDNLLDQEVFSPRDEWLEFNHLRSGSYFSRKIQESTSFLDVNGLPDVQLRDVEEGYANAKLAHEEYLTAEDSIVDRFGEAGLKCVFEPVLRKIAGLPPTELLPSVLELYGLSRLVMFSPELTRELKRYRIHDSRLAFHSRDEGYPSDRSRVFRYPLHGGIGSWARRMQSVAKESGVRFITGVSANHVRPRSDGGVDLTLSNGQELHARKLVWTVAGALLLRAAGVSAPCAPPPMTSGLTLYHFVFDLPPKTKLHYLTNYDPNFASYRVTFYTNVQLQTALPGRYHLTVEVIQNKYLQLPPNSETVIEELLTMGLITPETRLIAKSTTSINQGFPLPTIQLQSSTRINEQLLRDLFPDTEVLGRGQGGAFFLRDALKECARLFS